MTTAFKPGKRQALIPLDSPTRARCAGEPCRDGVVYCPRHHPLNYADYGSRRRAKAPTSDVIVVTAPTLAEGIDLIAAEVAKREAP